MTMRRRSTGLPSRGLTQLAAQVALQRRNGLRAAGLELVAAIKEELSKPGTGRVYKRPRRKKDGTIKKGKKTGKTLYRTHQASAPGEPPAVDYGTLRNSIQYAEEGTKARVGTNVEYAVPLEFGAPERRLAKRPFMRPALAKTERKMGQALAKALRTRRTP